MRLTRGTTLIEVLAAFAVISTGLMAVMGLAFANRRLSQGNVDQMVATNLAREYIELIMQMRDSSWLAGVSVLFLDTTATLVWSGDPAQTAPVFDFTPNTFADDETNIVLVGTPPFMANKNVAAGITGTATPYRRLITLTALCDPGTFPPNEAIDGTCPPAEVRVGTRIRSEVRWTRDNASPSVVMYTDLYEWR